MNISTAFSLAALRTPVIVPPALPAAYARSIDGYFTLSGALNVSEPSLQHGYRNSDIEIYRISEKENWKLIYLKLPSAQQ